METKLPIGNVKPLENHSLQIKETDLSVCEKVATAILGKDISTPALSALSSDTSLVGKVNLNPLNLPPALYRELFKNNVSSSKERLEQEIELERAMTRNREVWGIVEQRFYSFIQQLRGKNQ